jgi:hypothetical protein
MSLASISISKQLGLSMGQSQEGVNVREPSTANLGISSIDRYGTQVYVKSEQNPANTVTLSSPYDFSIGQNQNLMNGFFTRLAVTEVQFRWTLPTLTSRNNKIYITSGGTDTLITLPEGWYDTSAGASSAGNLAYALQVAVVAASISGLSGFTCTTPASASSTTVTTQPYNCFIAKSNSATTFYFKRYTDLTKPNAIGLFEMMSWTTNQVLATTQTGSPDASLLSTPFVDVVCDNLTYNQSLKDADTGISRDVLCRIYLTPDAFTGNVANLGSAPILIHRCFPFPKQVRWSADQPIGNLRIQVYDSEGYLLTTGDGLTGTSQTAYYDADMGDWNMNLLVSEV